FTVPNAPLCLCEQPANLDDIIEGAFGDRANFLGVARQQGVRLRNCLRAFSFHLRYASIGPSTVAAGAGPFSWNADAPTGGATARLISGRSRLDFGWPNAGPEGACGGSAGVEKPVRATAANVAA